MILDAAGDKSARAQRRAAIQAEYVAASGDDICEEFRDTNKRTSRYDKFWELAQGVVDDLGVVADDRRQGAAHMSRIVSIAAFRREVMKDLPSDAPCPSVEWIRLQFLLTRAWQRSALKHTGRFRLVRRVQIRNERLRGVDSLWVHGLARNCRQWVVMQRDGIMSALASDLEADEAMEAANRMVAYFSVDDKANVPVSLPAPHACAMHAA